MNIKINNLTKEYDQLKAIDNFSLEIPGQTIYGIIGRSGVGKSTLLRIISLLEKPSAGRVYFNDKRVDNLNSKELIEKRRSLGMIFQNFNLFSSRNVIENVSYPLELIKKPKKERYKKAQELLELVGLADKIKSPISQLSGGQKQRVAIARALSCSPQILFCDEATSALDPQTTTDILKLISDLQKQLKLTVVMVTHQMEVVRDTCEYVAVLESGKLCESGKVVDVFANPKSRETKDMIAHLSDKNFFRWNDGGYYTLRFRGDLTKEPIMSRLSRKYEVEFNVCAGGMQRVGQESIGTILCDIVGRDENKNQTLAELRERGILVDKEQWWQH